MAVSALSSISSEKFLLQVWEDMYKSIPKKKKDRKNGVDKVSAREFNAHKSQHVDEISKCIRNGTYLPSSLSVHFIPKVGSKDRVICVPTIRDRFVQRAILEFLNNKNYTLNNAVSYGFVRGAESGVRASLEKAIGLRKEHPWIYKADISAFFDSLDRAHLRSLIRKKIRLSSLRDLICLFVDCEVKVRSKAERDKLELCGIQRRKGLRQGMPLSPYLANLYLGDFDKFIIRKKIPLLRYADDLIAFSSSREGCVRIDEICRAKANTVGLTIHSLNESEKTVIGAPRETIEFLGIGIARSTRGGYKQEVTKKKIDAMKDELRKYQKISYCLDENISILNFQSVLMAKVRGYLEAYSSCSNYNSLNSALLDTYVHVKNSLLVGELGIKQDSLDDRQLQFLNLGSKELL